MPPDVTYMQKRFFSSLYRAYETVASEHRYFVRPYAPTKRALKQQVWDALARNLPYYVTIENNEVTGWAAIIFPTLPSLAHSGTVVMGVMPDYRHTGLGTALLGRALAHAFEDPVHCRIQLEVFRDNNAAVALYTKLGFYLEGTAKQAVFVGGDYRDVLHMALFRIES